MVSTIVFRSHKVVKIKSVKPFQLLVLLVVGIAFLAYQPELFSFLFAFCYLLSGPFDWAADV
jgi:hypothetical protein